MNFDKYCNTIFESLRHEYSYILLSAIDEYEYKFKKRVVVADNMLQAHAEFVERCANLNLGNIVYQNPLKTYAILDTPHDSYFEFILSSESPYYNNLENLLNDKHIKQYIIDKKDRTKLLKQFEVVTNYNTKTQSPNSILDNDFLKELY